MSMDASVEPAEVYLPDAVYEELKAKLVQLAAEPFENFGTDPATEVVTALGEIGGVWTECVKTNTD